MLITKLFAIFWTYKYHFMNNDIPFHYYFLYFIVKDKLISDSSLVSYN